MIRRTTVSVIILAVFAVIAMGFFAYYHRQLGKNVDWHNKVLVDRETQLSETVFDLAMKSKLIASSRGPKGEIFITPPPCEGLLLKSVEQDKERYGALNVLCNSPQGEAIRDEIHAWNASYDLVAVRDNRSQNEECAQPPLQADIFVPRDCKRNTWRAERLLHGRAVTAHWIPRAEPPIDEFYMLADADEPTLFAGDWAMLRSDQAAGAQRPRYRLSDRLVVPDGAAEVSIEVAGRLRKVTVGSADLSITASKPETPQDGVRLGSARVEVYLVCGDEAVTHDNEDDPEDEDDSPDADDCSVEPVPETRRALAYQVRVRIDRSVPAAARRTVEGRTLQIALEVEPVENLPPGLRNVDAERRVALARTLHLRASCGTDRERDALCDLSWNHIPGTERKTPHEYRIVVNDGDKQVDLVNPKTGIILPTAFEAGLAPIVGLGPQDWGSLSAALDRRQPPLDADKRPMALPPVRLTIDQRIQRAAQRIVDASPSCKSRRSNDSKRQLLPNCVRLRNDQSVALVVMDADQKPGEIKAVSSWPPVPRHLHIWDIQALETRESGQGGIGWRLISVQQRPGSAFKAITSIAAIEAATTPAMAHNELQNNLKTLLAGQMSLRDQTEFLRLHNAAWNDKTRKCDVRPSLRGSPNSIPVPNDQQPRWCARNFKKGVYWAARAPTVSGCPPADPRRDQSQFGACEALMVSSNLFFGGISWRLLEVAKTPVEELLIAKVARRLTFGDTTDTVASFDLLRDESGVTVPKLRPHHIQLDLRSAEGARRNLPSLVRTGFGDGEAATPLAMATAYASIASNRTVRPTLTQLRRDAGCPVVKVAGECELLLPNTGAAASFLAHLKGGLHAVAAAPGGTANGSFRNEISLLRKPNGEPRLFLKTGTATTSMRPAQFALWTVGWIDGVPTVTGIEERLAFACMITKGRKNDTGGGTCARLIRQLLLDLNQRPPR